MKLALSGHVVCVQKSHPSRGAWIEILQKTQQNMPEEVAPLAGCVD